MTLTPDEAYYMALIDLDTATEYQLHPEWCQEFDLKEWFA